MKKLQLTDSENAWELLGEYAGLYGDNGGDSDGPAWLPSDQDDIPDHIAQTVIDAGLGHMVNVDVLTDDEVAARLQLPELQARFANGEDDEEDAERLQEAAKEQGLQYAHFGAYGAGDSQWVVIVEE